MPGSANDLIKIPAWLWQRADMREALRCRDVGKVFQLVQQYSGASQTQIGMACVLTQPKVSELIRHLTEIEELAVFERIANGLAMPGSARADLGLAARSGPDRIASATAITPAPVIPARDTPPPARTTARPGPASVDQPRGEEDAGDVQRRAFVTLTGASLFGAILATAAPAAPSDGIETFAALLTGITPDTATPTLPGLDLRALAAAVARAKLDYQACRYTDVIEDMRWLLPRIQTACAVLTGDARLRACTLSPTPIMSPRASCSSWVTRAWHGWRPIGACKPPAPAKIR